ncbi:hypothetical protein [Streptomyces sp. NPDC050287]|uniref:hypothetical protein n=1 Tax=Streptomyces sp. NPDC050287 TaxID=3365608 RepID=UPI0037990CB1
MTWPSAANWSQSGPGTRSGSADVTSAVRDAADGRFEDDATAMCLDWHGAAHETQRHVSSGADTRQASSGRTKQ